MKLPLFFLAVLFSCGEGTKPFKSSTGQISIELPSGWRVLKERDWQEYTFENADKTASLAISPLYWAKDSSSQMQVLESELAHVPGATRNVSNNLDVVHFRNGGGNLCWLVRKSGNLYRVIYEPTDISSREITNSERANVESVIASLRP
jgi:hypothetical protein